jgi:Zn finger protein HypA/HybF involved in hydrogenase expression
LRRIEMKDEFKNCPDCGYRQGFHSMFKKDNEAIKWLFICPACHSVFDLGFTVPE